ncbi:MAG: protein jag [Selenomonadaceae bacterium]|nr:protein jag [Selenomonadaceae bacterium]
MTTTIEKTGKTVEDAVSAALQELGVTSSEIEFTVLEKPSKGFLGFGARPAKVKVTLKEIPKPVEPQPEPAAPLEPVEEKTAPTVETEILTEPAEPEPVIEPEPPAENSEPESAFDKSAVIESARNFLARVFTAMNAEVEINVKENESDVILDLVGKSLGVLIGKHGQTLDALQYLTNLAANRASAPEKIYFVLDAENYRERRAKAILKLAKSAADRAVRTRQDVKLEPMSRSERRLIHTALQDNNKIETHSAGEDPYRYIIISPKKRAR